MASSNVITKTDLGKYTKHLSTGKVRELYEIDDKTILFVATDRVSAFDVILSNGIPDKGALLTGLTAHWFQILTSKLPHLHTHFISLDLPQSLLSSATPEVTAQARRRSMQVRKLRILPIESIVRGYITGSAWSEYKRSGTMHGSTLPMGLQECAQLPEPLWTPSTKAEVGDKDENISAQQAAGIVGQEVADAVARLSVELYVAARDYAAERGIIIADTKFEFGIDDSISGDDVARKIVLADEVLTPDSSRFWDASKYEAGRAQDSLDKQVLRDWLVENGLKGEEGVSMTDEVVKRTREGYVEAFERLTGSKWASL